MKQDRLPILEQVAEGAVISRTTVHRYSSDPDVPLPDDAYKFNHLIIRARVEPLHKGNEIIDSSNASRI